MTTTIPNNTLVNDGLLYITGLELAITSGTTMTMQAGQARNNTNINDIVLSAPVTLSTAVNGANGLDTGTIANNTFYAVLVIGSSTFAAPTAMMLTTQANLASPYLPLNYDMYQRIGFVRTGGSATFVQTYWEGHGTERICWYDSPISVLSAGTSSSNFASVALSLEIPVTPTTAIFEATFTPASAGQTFALRPTGSSSSTGQVVVGNASTTGSAQQVLARTGVSAGATYIDYKVTASGSLDLSVMGYFDHLLG